MRCALLVLLLVLLVLPGCKGGGTAMGCEEYATDLGKRLEVAALEPLPPFAIEGDFQPVERADLPVTPLGYRPVLHISATTATYQGQALSATALRERLTEARAKVAEDIERGMYRGESPDPRQLYVVIDRRAPWPLVVESFDAARAAEMPMIGIVFTTKPTTQLPPRAPVDDELDALLREEPNERASKFARLVEKQVAGCPEVQQVFGNVGADPAESKAMTIAKALPKALISCRCRVPKENLRSVMLRLLHIEKPARVVQLQPDAEAETIELPATATWADAAARIAPTTRNVTLAVAAK